MVVTAGWTATPERQRTSSTRHPSPEKGDSQRLLDTGGEQLSQPKRQKGITDYSQMCIQKPSERNKMDGEVFITDAKHPEEAGGAQTPAEKSHEEDATPRASTPSL